MTEIDKNQNIRIPKGDTFYLYSTATENGSSIDFSGWTALMEIKEKTSDTTTLITVTESTGISLTTGIMTITISATTMNTLDVGEYVYSLRLIRSDGRKETWALDKKLTVLQNLLET